MQSIRFIFTQKGFVIQSNSGLQVTFEAEAGIPIPRRGMWFKEQLANKFLEELQRV
jgi:hypothetical protein